MSENKPYKRKIQKRWTLCVCGLLILVSALSNSTLSAKIETHTALSKLAVMEGGRVKPLDTFAQNVLKQLSGQSKLKEKSAIFWLAKVIFSPAMAYDDKIFLITNPEVLDSISVKRQGKARDRYSYSQLREALPKLRQLAMKASKIEGKNRSFVENEIITLYNKLYLFRQLLSTLDFLAPHRDFTITDPQLLNSLQLSREKKSFSFLAIAEKITQLKEIASSTNESRDPDIENMKKLSLTLTRRLEDWSKSYQNLPLLLIPPKESTARGSSSWQSPWDLLNNAISTPNRVLPKELYLLADMQTAFINNQQESFLQACENFSDIIKAKAGYLIRERAISLEVIYNKIDPFYKSKFFYGFALILLLLSLITLKKITYRTSFILMFVGFLLHLAGTITRMYIMVRPPVTNLYETFTFTGLITVLLGMVLELSKKKKIGILCGSLAGLVMLMIAGKYALEGDTMGMLVAVLDSNFWLASHVITIILGYAGIVLSGFIGHVYIIQTMMRKPKRDVLNATFTAVYSIQAFGIIFTFLGTVLGGIWADQSWGRFWGWDPKENGALLILLWSALLFHAKLAKLINRLGFAIGSVIGIVAVSLAWFGVNLLGVGLHSYGFTSGIARSLFTFITLELLFLLITSAISKFRQKL